MKIVNVAPLALTVELTPTDCIALARAVRQSGHDGCDGDLNAALAAALLAGAFGAYALSGSDAPTTLRHLWETWAPYATDTTAPTRLPLPQEWAAQATGD